MTFEREVVHFEKDGPVILDFYSDGSIVAGSKYGIQHFTGTKKDFMAKLQAYGEQQQNNNKGVK